MTDVACCRTCTWWTEGDDASAAHPPSTYASELGTCSARPPTVIAGLMCKPATFFPVTHARRSCSDWMPDEEEDGDDDGGGEEADAGGGEEIDAGAKVLPFDRMAA